MSGIKLFGIGAAFWALIFGVVSSLLTENEISTTTKMENICQ